MHIVFDPRQDRHAPLVELHNGGWTPHAETAERAAAILAALGPSSPPVDRGMGPILAVHDEDYVAFLKSAFADWQAAGREGEAIGYCWPVVARRAVALDRIDARLGRYSFDASSPIGPGTFEAAYWSVQSALGALAHVLEGRDRAAFALCRPPGHHCGRDYLGGYSYLNSAAVAAEAAVAAGRRVAILDVDYHHGNGTQDIFLARGDVLFVSLHADPRTDYPFYWGHADEMGVGEGAGATCNLPLPRGTQADDYLRALDRACERVSAHGADLLVVSFGADTFEGDPISHFRLKTGDYPRLGRAIAGLGLPTLVVMEGGYAVSSLGDNVAAFLSGLDG